MSSEDSMELIIGEVEFNMNRTNTSLFTFLGRSALDHLFLVHETEENKAYGTYVFSLNTHFDDLVAFAIKHSFPAHLNMLAVAQCDQDAYDNAIQQAMTDLNDSFPDEWTA